MSINSTNVVATAPNSAKVIISVESYDGPKATKTPYLKDASDSNSPLQKLNFQSFKNVFMIDDESIVVVTPDKNGIDQLHYGKINATDDQFQQVTNFTRSAGDFKFVASTNTLYYTMATTDPMKRDDGAVFMLYNKRSTMISPGGYEKSENEVDHIFTAKYSISNGNMTLGNSTDIFEKVDKPFNVDGFQVTENGEWIGFTAPSGTLQQSGQDDFNNDLFLVPTNMTQQPFKISDTEQLKSTVSSFSFSPSGNKVLWNIREPSDTNLAVGFFSYDINSRAKKSYLDGSDYNAGYIAPISDNVFAFNAEQNDTTKIFTCDMTTDKVTVRSGDDFSVFLSSLIRNGTKYIVAKINLLTPPELAIMDTTTWETKPLTNVSTEFMSQFEMHKVERTSFKGWNNETVTGFIHKPAGFDPSKKYPAIVMPHGGPNSAMTNSWIVGNVWNPEIFAAAGYFVIITNFHGSTGHGKKFMESINGQWGGNAYEDVMQGLDEALKKYTQIDSKRVCAMGASYGGYMTNWLSGKSPERFACFITHAGLFDLDSMYLTGPFGKFDKDLEFTAPGSKDVGIPDLSKYSPAKYTNNWVKPTLVSHGGMDTNVPIDQGLAAFTALQYRNITSKFLYFPTESHVVADPPNVAVQIDAYLDWLNTYTKV